MASQTTSKTPVKPHSKVQTYVNRQLDRTRRQVKSTDLITRLIVGVLLVLAMLQIFAIIDAWVWSFNPAARWLCFLSLLGAIAAYGVLAVAPLFMRKIHPDYAAKMIEDERPSFKNSLLNYVSLRKQPARTHTAIMDAVSKQAALDLQTVPDDAAVDQSSIIRSGTILLGLIGFAVVYWLVSPKDPLQSFSRVLLPSIKQSAPSVVQVLDVSPGDHEIFFGDSIEVAATIKGSFNPEDVKLVYSTTDGQLVDQEVAMLPETDANRRFTALLPPDQSGIQQSLIYRVVARDGQSPDYDIVVKPNPSISIDALTITPPAYTGLPVETLGGQENIEAPEGSNVRVEALANLPIKLAYMELLKRKNGGDQQGDDFRIVETVKMLVDSQNPQRAAGEFLAVLNSDRTDSKASHYRLKFLSTTDDRNQRANISPIRVIADLAPELDVLNPLKNRSKLPANETMLIEARAFDIDYGISSIQLNMDNKGSSVFPVKSLQLRSEQGKQRVKGRFLFKPEEHFLRSGDIVVFALTANDNRVSHLSGMLDPNSVQSRQYQVEITDAVENPKAPPEPGQQEKKKDQSGDQQEPSDEQKKSEQGANQDGGDGDGDGQASESDQPKDGESSEQKESESGSSGSQSGDQSEEGESSDSASGGSESDGGSESGESGDGQQGSNESGESSQMSEGGGSESDSSEGDSSEGGGQEQTDTESSGSNQKPSDSGSSDQEGSSSSGNQTGDGSESRGEKPQPQSGESKNGESNRGEGSDRQGDESGESGAGDQADGESGGQGGNAQQQEGEERKPLGENATDGERMSRLEEMMKEEQAKNGEGQNDEGQNGESQSSDDADAAKQNTGSGKDPEQNDPRESQGTGSMQEDNAKAAEEGAENNAQKGDGSSSSSQGNQDGTAKGSSGSKTGEQSNEGASSDDSDKGQSNETGGKEAGESKTESGNENSTPSKDGQGAAGKSEEGGAQPSDQAGENGGNQKSQEGDGQPGEQGGQPGQEGGQPGEQGDKASDKSSEEASGKPGEQAGDKAGKDPQEGGKPGEQGEGGEPSESGEGGQPGQKGAGEEAGSGGAESGEAGKAGQGGQGESGEAQGAAAGDGGESTEQGDNVGSGQGGGRQHNMIKEKENLEHSRKATDMVLNRLEEQRYDPDPELLEELNWSKDDLNQFLDRWNEMKQKAETGTDPAAKRRYEQAIKSLGLSPDSGQRKVKGVSDEKTGFKTDSAVNRPPPRVAPAFKAYLRDRNRATQD